MSAGIENNRDYQVGLTMAWHGKTRIVTELTKTDTFPEITDYPLTYTIGEKTFTMPDTFVPISGDDNLPCGIPHASSYTLFTPRQAWENVEEYLAGTGYKFASGGMLFNRSNWFISVELSELQEVSNGTGSKFELGFFGGLDKSMSPQLILSNVRAVCANTVRLAIQSGDKVFGGVKLTKNFNQKLEDAKLNIEEQIGMARVFNETMKQLQNTAATVQEAKQVYTGFLVKDVGLDLSKKDRTGAIVANTRTVNMINSLTGLFSQGRGADEFPNTRFNVLQGATELWTRGDSSIKTTKNEISRFESSEFGAYADRKKSFLELVSNNDRYSQTREIGEKALVDAHIV